MPGTGSGGAQITDTSPSLAKLTIPCPMVHMQKSVGRGDAVTTGFLLGDNYEAGYLDIFVNGLKQRVTTHWTEGSADVGNFSFVQAPATNDYIDAIYAKQCDCGLVPCASVGNTTSVTPGLGTGPGKRVIIAGRTTSTPRFGWTENIFAATPAWTSNTTGLPASSSIVKCLRLDPFNPTSSALMVLEHATQGAEVYRNTAYRTGGSWTKIFSYTDVASPSAFFINDIQYSIASPGRIYIFWGASGVGFGTSCSHTHNNGTSWTNINIHSTQPVSDNGNMVVGQHNADKLWISNPDGSNPDSLFRSSDGGHTWVQELHPVTNSAGVVLAVPYEGNSSDANVYWGLSGGLYKSTDSGDNFSSYSTATFSANNLFFCNSQSSLMWTFLEGSDTIYKSNDTGATFTAYTAPTNVDAASLLRNVLWYIANAGASPTVRTSPSFATGTFTNRSGDVATTVWGSAAVSAALGNFWSGGGDGSRSGLTRLVAVD